MLLAEEDYLYDNYPLESPEAEIVPKQNPKPQKKPKLRIKLLGVLVLTGISGFLLCQSVTINQQQGSILKLKSRLESVTADLEQLKVDVATDSEVVSVKDKATKEYGMQEPSSSQIVNIKY